MDVKREAPTSCWLAFSYSNYKITADAWTSRLSNYGVCSVFFFYITAIVGRTPLIVKLLQCVRMFAPKATVFPGILCGITGYVSHLSACLWRLLTTVCTYKMDIFGMFCLPASLLRFPDGLRDLMINIFRCFSNTIFTCLTFWFVSTVYIFNDKDRRRAEGHFNFGFERQK